MTFSIDQNGWLAPAPGVVLHPECSHWDEREGDGRIDLVILHNITVPAYETRTGMVEALFLGKLRTCGDPFLDPLVGIRVSSHFFISRDGAVHQFVSTLKRAWHAGVSSFMGRTRCNDFSIGIEIEGTDFSPFEERQYRALEEVLSAVHERHAPRFVAAHSDVAPGRKTDPGPYFDWVRLYRARRAFGSPEFPGAAAAMQLSARRAAAGILA
jgi:AmpD protein